MKRWNEAASDFVEDPRVDDFIADIVTVCIKHGMTIGHEDGHGAFLVHLKFDPANVTWLQHAAIARRS